MAQPVPRIDTGEANPVERDVDGGSRWHHLLAIGWCVLLAFFLLGPALLHGSMIGSYHLLAGGGLTSRAGVSSIGNYFNTDPINQMIPWTSVTWTQVHHGFVPLWNPYNGLGLPLAFNWQSAVFSIPSVAGYLVPLRDAYTVGLIVTLVIAGSGGYVLGRVLRLGILGALTIATVFELCGPLVAWLGYPQAQTMAWGGWLFAAGLLVLRGRRRIPSITLFAVVTACSIYSGHPETLVVMMAATLLFLAVTLATRGFDGGFGFTAGPILRPAIDAVIALLAGTALVAPLLLPGLQLSTTSIRSNTDLGTQVPAHEALYFLFSSFDGVPVSGSYAFGGSYFYNETAAYAGVIALALAVVGILAGFAARNRAVVTALLFVLIVIGVVGIVNPVANAVSHIPALDEVDWLRALMPVCLVIAVLAGMGCDAVARSDSHLPVRTWLLAVFGGATVLLGLIWLVGHTSGLPAFDTSLAQHVRDLSFIWPAAGTALGLIVAVALIWRPHWRVQGAAVLLCGEATLLIVAGSILISSSSNGYPPTHAVSTLQRLVGSERIATGGDGGPGVCTLTIAPDANIFYGLYQLEDYDPILPKAYFSQWVHEAHTQPGSPELDEFCPNLTTSAQARQFGVSYVLVPHGDPGLPGSVKRTTLRVPNPHPGNVLSKPPVDVDVYEIPRSSIAALSTDDGKTSPVRISSNNPAQMTMVTRSTNPGDLRIRVTNVPGWHATVDGRSVPLEQSSVYELRLRVPAGAHQIEFRYWPPLFSVGILLAGATVIALGALLVWDWRRTSRRRPNVTRTN